MHEFREVQALIQEVGRRVKPGRRVKRLVIAVGEASGHSPRHIEEHFREAARGTVAEGAALEFVGEKLSAHCAACGAVFCPNDRAFTCTQCGGAELVFTAGKEVRLASVETDGA